MTATGTTPTRLRGDEGVVLVELVLVPPLLVLLSIGILEYGAGWNDATAAERALLTGGRVLSNEGNARQADQEALIALSAGLEPGTRSDVRR